MLPKGAYHQSINQSINHNALAAELLQG